MRTARKTQLHFLLASASAAVAIATVTPALAAGKTGSQNVIMVLDSSGSMAGKINGIRKIDIARKAVRSIVGSLDTRINLGLIAYGHRRKGDCGDIQTIYPIGTKNRAALSSAIDQLRPVGKTPLSAAVRQAANQMKYTEEKATVILVSDGKETCDADPCQLGKQLKARGVDFKVHVVGFNIRRGDEAGLQCLANNTGGIYVSANNAGALNKALQKTITVTQAKPTPPPPAPKPAIAPGVKVRAFISSGGKEWPGSITLDFYGQPKGLEKKRKRIRNVWKVKSGTVVKNLAPGEYLMNLSLGNHGHIKKQVPVNYRGGATTVDVNLNIAQVRLNAVFNEAGKTYKGWSITWDVLEPKVDFAGKRKRLVNFWKVPAGHVNWLPEGKWMLAGHVAAMGHIRKTTTLALKAGEQKVHTVNFNAGLLRFDTRLAPEAKPFAGAITWDVYGGKPDLSGKRKRIANFWRVGPKKILMLPAGEWDVYGHLKDAAHVRFKTKIKVQPGGEEAYEVIANAAKVRFDVTVDGRPVKEAVNIDILGMKKDLAGKQQKIASYWRIAPGTVSFLPAGEHLLRASLHSNAKVTGGGTIAITAGEEQALKIDLKTK
ncbi:MAG: VWA domain-containing protein [Hyphomicrobiales bacterium]|nr:VWA domain-containing protein [Hyphomicrobiales bacterium]